MTMIRFSCNPFQYIRHPNYGVQAVGYAMLMAMILAVFVILSPVCYVVLCIPPTAQWIVDQAIAAIGLPRIHAVNMMSLFISMPLAAAMYFGTIWAGFVAYWMGMRHAPLCVVNEKFVAFLSTPELKQNE